MQFSQYGALLGLFGSAVQASSAVAVAPRSSAGSCSKDLTTSWEKHTFYSG